MLNKLRELTNFSMTTWKVIKQEPSKDGIAWVVESSLASYWQSPFKLLCHSLFTLNMIDLVSITLLKNILVI